MTKVELRVLVAEQKILNRIYVIRNQKVMLDEDLAHMYGVETKQLKRQVKRNIERFPKDFMFTLTKKELENLAEYRASAKENYLKAREALVNLAYQKIQK